jgi:hypothetical protein
LLEQQGKLDKPHSEVYGEEYAKFHSPLFLGQTRRQFNQIIHAMLSQEGLDVRRIIEFQRREREGGEGDKARTELFEYTFSAYVSLRELGYLKQDLTG